MNVSSKEASKSVSVDGFFSANYPEIRKWAMEIASYDKSVSEDLIHDAYLKLQARRCDLSVDDPNAYVYVAMRNTFRSQVRGQAFIKKTYIQQDEYAFDQHPSQDPRMSLNVGENLMEICEYACSRRRATISASLMILRYFLGYSIEDLSKVANRPRSVLDTRLAAFRRGIESPVLGPASSQGRLCWPALSWEASLVFDRIRERVFRSAEGRCIPYRQLRRAYRWKSGRPDRDELRHLASCRLCLETANQLLKLDSLDQRHPLDILRTERLLATCSIT